MDSRTNEAFKHTQISHEISPPISKDAVRGDGWSGIEDPTVGMEPIIMSRKWAEEGTQPEVGAGWPGRGAPIKVHQGHRIRDLEDGAGRCSPSRWNRHKRRLPDTEGLAGDLIRAMDLDLGVWDRNLMAMLAGKGEK